MEEITTQNMGTDNMKYWQRRTNKIIFIKNFVSVTENKNTVIDGALTVANTTKILFLEMMMEVYGS